MSIKSEIERLNNTVAEQAGLIEEIIGALEGKINQPPTIVSYNVSNVEGATHGFVFSGDYYVSQNKCVSSSAAVCRIDFNATMPVKVNVYCISYGENNYDFGILSNLNKMLTTSSSEDSTGVYKSFKGLSSSSEQLVTYDLPAGKNFISIKYKKDNSGNKNDDTLKFRIEISGA